MLAPDFAHLALTYEEEALLRARRANELKSEPAPRVSDAAKEEYDDEVVGRRPPPDLVRAARREEVNFMLDWKTWERMAGPKPGAGHADSRLRRAGLMRTRATSKRPTSRH